MSVPTPSVHASQKPSPASPRPKPKAPKPKALLDKHLKHIREHFARLRAGYMSVPDSEAVFLGASEGGTFWELIGMRLSGHPAPILGMVRFRRHDLPGVQHARESLATYLSSPPSGDSGRRGPATLDVVLPRANQSIPHFLRSHRGGNGPAPVHLDPSIIAAAFDFRMENPFSIEASRLRAKPLKRRLYRTAQGHVLTGLSHDPANPHLADSFMAIKNPIQHTPKGRLGLPSLALNRSFVALSADVEDERTRLAAAHWVPFAPSSGLQRHLLLA